MQKLTELKGIKDIKVSQMPIVADCIKLIYNAEIIVDNGKFYSVTEE